MTTLDARLHLLDRQLVDDDGDPIGIVDDLELDGVELDQDIAEGTPAPRVAALLSGQVPPVFDPACCGGATTVA